MWVETKHCEYLRGSRALSHLTYPTMLADEAMVLRKIVKIGVYRTDHRSLMLLSVCTLCRAWGECEKQMIRGY